MLTIGDRYVIVMRMKEITDVAIIEQQTGK